MRRQERIKKAITGFIAFILFCAGIGMAFMVDKEPTMWIWSALSLLTAYVIAYMGNPELRRRN